MPWSGGVFTRTNGTYTGATVWQQDDGAGIDIDADRHDTHDEDIAQGINECLNRNGENSMAANIPMNGNSVTGLGAGVADDEALNKGQGDSEYIQTDGTSTVTADIPMGSNKVTDLANGTANSDAINFGQAKALGMEWAFVQANGTGAPSILAQSGGISVANVSTQKTRVTFSDAASSKNAQGFSAFPTTNVRIFLPDQTDSGNERTTTSVVVTQETWAGASTAQQTFYVFRTRA